MNKKIFSIALIAISLAGCAGQTTKPSDVPDWTYNSSSQTSGYKLFVGIGSWEKDEAKALELAIAQAYKNFNNWVGVKIRTNGQLTTKTESGVLKTSSSSNLKYSGEVFSQGGQVLKRHQERADGRFKYYVQIAIPNSVAERERARFELMKLPKQITKTVRIKAQPEWSINEAYDIAILKAKSKIIEEAYQNKVKTKVTASKKLEYQYSSEASGHISRFEVLDKQNLVGDVSVTVRGWTEKD